jgi:hypothetical protein
MRSLALILDQLPVSLDVSWMLCNVVFQFYICIPVLMQTGAVDSPEGRLEIVRSQDFLLRYLSATKRTSAPRILNDVEAI